LFRDCGDRDGEAATRDSLGFIAHHNARYDEALHHYHEALTLDVDLGHIYNVADILDHLGQTYIAIGDEGQARAAWQQAVDLYRSQHRNVTADRMQQQLDALDDDSTPQAIHDDSDQ
jgi:tetratricopeptide (TPR) repeat protein